MLLVYVTHSDVVPSWVDKLVRVEEQESSRDVERGFGGEGGAEGVECF